MNPQLSIFCQYCFNYFPPAFLEYFKTNLTYYILCRKYFTIYNKKGLKNNCTILFQLTKLKIIPLCCHQIFSPSENLPNLSQNNAFTASLLRSLCGLMELDAILALHWYVNLKLSVHGKEGVPGQRWKC